MMAVCLLLSAYFSATETAFSSANSTRLKTLAEKGNKNAALACRLLGQYDKLLSTILIGNNIVNILMASIGTVLFVRCYGDAGATISTVVVTVVVLIFGASRGWLYAGYSIVFQFISTQTISTFHHRYEQITIEATTGNAELLSDHYIEHFRHGMTVIQGYGAYSHKRVYICKTVVSSYEVHDVVMCLRQVDPAVIINTYRTNSFYGRFYQKPIDDM